MEEDTEAPAGLPQSVEPMPGPSTMWQAEKEEGYGEADMDSTSYALFESLIREHEKKEDEESILGSPYAPPPPPPPFTDAGTTAASYHPGPKGKGREYPPIMVERLPGKYNILPLSSSNWQPPGVFGVQQRSSVEHPRVLPAAAVWGGLAFQARIPV